MFVCIKLNLHSPYHPLSVIYFHLNRIFHKPKRSIDSDASKPTTEYVCAE